MEIKEKLSEKAGPLPVWGWVLVVSIGGYVLYRYYAGKKKTSSDKPVREGAVTVKANGELAGEDTGVQEQLNDINEGVTNGDNELARIGTNIGHEAKDIHGIGTVITRPPTTQKYGAADVQSYFIVHDTKTNQFWYVHPADKKIFVLKPGTAQADISKFKAKVIQKPGRPTYKGEKIVYV